MTNGKALSRSERFHFDAHGYVLLRGVLTHDEVEAIKLALYRLRSESDPAAKRVYTERAGGHFFKCGNLVGYDPALLAFAAHPKLTAYVEEVVGGKIRLEESEAIINRRDPTAELPVSGSVPLGFHTGADVGWGTFEQDGRFHCLFVKTLAYLTDVGPDDGGTAVIPGSHRMGWSQEEMISAAYDDPSLIVQVEASAGDVLLFPETLIHSTTAIRSERERVIVVSGYTPTILRAWPGNEPQPNFVASLPDHLKPLIGGSESWPWRRS